jgi:hypothetical protein
LRGFDLTYARSTRAFLIASVVVQSLQAVLIVIQALLIATIIVQAFTEGATLEQVMPRVVTVGARDRPALADRVLR